MGVVRANWTGTGGETPSGPLEVLGHQDHLSATDEPTRPPSDRFQILAGEPRHCSPLTCSRGWNRTSASASGTRST